MLLFSLREVCSRSLDLRETRSSHVPSLEPTRQRRNYTLIPALSANVPLCLMCITATTDADQWWRNEPERREKNIVWQETMLNCQNCQDNFERKKINKAKQTKQFTLPMAMQATSLVWCVRCQILQRANIFSHRQSNPTCKARKTVRSATAAYSMCKQSRRNELFRCC